jgi:hypothetical protein
VATVVWLPKTAPKQFTLIEKFISLQNLILFDIIAILCSVLIIAVNIFIIPKAILTPMGRIAILYLLPLSAAWVLYFRGDPIGARRFVYFIPGIISYILNPYREVLVVNFCCILLPALQLRRITSWYKLALWMLLFLLVSTQITQIYRDYLWMNTKYYYQEKLAAQWENWQQTPANAPWVKLENRFHGFDSMALTTFFVPNFMPYSDRPLLQEMLVRAFIPRLIYSSKSALQRGREFSKTIWTFNTRGKAGKEDAMIAPSLPGDLYSVYGLSSLIIGALCFGLLVGLLENWGRGLGTEARCLLLVGFGLQIAGALERDFTNGLANIIQQIIALYVFLIIVSVILTHTRSTSAKIKLVNTNR